jgi:hypothetical protein
MSDTRPRLTAPTASPPDAGAGTAMVPPLVSSITPSVEHTVARWSEEVLEPAAIDWSGVLLGALQHRVEGLCADALRLAGWHDAAPPSAVWLLDRRRLAAEARFQAHYFALRELGESDPDLAARLVVVNGAALVRLYATTSHRLLGDVDLLVPPQLGDRLARWAQAAGFWRSRAPTASPTSGRAGPDHPTPAQSCSTSTSPPPRLGSDWLRWRSATSSCTVSPVPASCCARSCGCSATRSARATGSGRTMCG